MADVGRYHPSRYYWGIRKNAQLGRWLDMGGSLDDLAVTKEEFRDLPRSQRYRERSKSGTTYYRLPGQSDLLDRSEQLREIELDQMLGVYDSMDKVPILQQLKQEAMGNMSFDETYDKAFERVGSETLGAAAPSGFLRDQSPWLVADTAIRYATAMEQEKDEAQGQVLGAMGFPGYGGAPLSSLSTLMSAGSSGDYFNQSMGVTGMMVQQDWLRDQASDAKRGALYGAALGAGSNVGAASLMKGK